MSEKRCYYEVLSVSRTANSDELRKAYRQLALKFHPDRNPGDAAAETSFKEATEAFQVLADDDKRGRYDRFGHAGVDGGAPDLGSDIFSHFQDIFSEFFGGGGGRGRQRNGPARGADLRVQERLSLAESFVGCKREVNLRTPVACEPCSGSGAKPGTKRKPCAACGGAGQVSVARGFVMFSQTCGECSGEGSVVKTPCDACHGRGQVEKNRKVLVSFPAGIDGGQRLRVPGQGMAGGRGGPAGDLFVDVELLSDDAFERDGYDLLTHVELTMFEAALGSKREITLPDESTVGLELGAGAQPGDVVTVRNKGVPRLDGRGRGALHVAIDVSVPRDLSERARELMHELQREVLGAESDPSKSAKPASEKSPKASKSQPGKSAAG